MAVLVLIFCIFVYIKVGKGSIARLLALLLIASLGSYLLIAGNNDFEAVDILHAVWIIITISFVVMPWKPFKKITEVSVSDSRKVDVVAKIMGWFCVFMSVACLILSYYVLTNITNINTFKYVDGTSDFYYSLGIDMKGYILTMLFYPLGYLMMPLVFYYMSQHRNKMVLLCFLGSLLPVCYGLTYFSRAHMTHFALMYLMTYLLLSGLLEDKTRKRIRNTIVIACVLVVAGFTAISLSRFDEHDYSSETSGNMKSKYQNNSTLVSVLDYFSMWWSSSQELTRRFEFQTMHSSIALQGLDNFFASISFGLYHDHGKERMQRREALLKEHSGAFIGVGAYTLYDQGPILGLLLFMLYSWCVGRTRPYGGTITMERLLYATVLIQWPLFMIFYSVLDTILLSAIFLLPGSKYLRLK